MIGHLENTEGRHALIHLLAYSTALMNLGHIRVNQITTFRQSVELFVV